MSVESQQSLQNFVDEKVLSNNGAGEQLHKMELELKNLWNQYIGCLDGLRSKHAADDFRKKYFELYRTYRQQRMWREQLGQ